MYNVSYNKKNHGIGNWKIGKPASSAETAATTTATTNTAVDAIIPCVRPVALDKLPLTLEGVLLTLVSHMSPVHAPTHTQFFPSGHDPCPWQRFRVSGHDGTSGTNAFAREQTTERSGQMINPENGPSVPPGMGLLWP